MGFERRPLEEIVEDILDRRGVTPTKLGGEFVSSGHRVISAKLIKDGQIALESDEPRFISSDMYARWMKAPLKRGDVIMTSEAPLGELAYLDESTDWVLGQRLFAIRPRKEVIRGRFLYYALASPVVRDAIFSRASGSTVQGIRQAELRKVEIPVPPMSVQLEVESLLGALDERIDSLRKSSSVCETIAQAMFKSWFVDFDPVRAKAEGREPEGMDAATAALFPSELEASELGPIPKGWTAGRLADVVELKYGKSLRAADRNNGEIPVYGSGGVTGFHDKPLIEGPTVIVGRKGTVGSIYWESFACFPIDTVFYVEPKRSLHFAYFALQRAGLDGLNTDAAVPGLNRNNAYRQPVVIPPPELIHAWDVFAGALRSRIDTSQVHAANLSQLRDALLPRLISGKLRLPEAEREIEAATA